MLRKKDVRLGYVYAAEAEAGPMQNAGAGAVVRLPDRGPPWIVVDIDLANGREREALLQSWTQLVDASRAAPQT